MSYVTEAFSVYLKGTLSADAVTVPLPEAAEQDLLALLADEDDYTFATIRNDLSYETVKLRTTNGVLIMDRGQGGTSPVTHYCGSTMSLVSPTTIEALKATICEYDCCAEGDCECQGVTLEGWSAPSSVKIGETYEAYALFGGDTPIAAVVSGNAPSWLNVTITGGLVTLKGTAGAVGVTEVTVAAANCNGTKMTTATIKITVVSE